MTSPKAESLTAISSSSLPSEPKRVLLIFGTRPEAIKLCPLVAAFREHPECRNLKPVVCVTGQHRQMLDQVLAAFEVTPNYDLSVMQPGQTLTSLTARLMAALEPVLAVEKPAIVIVQGDTTTTFCGALAAFYADIPVAHVEAGLRTFDLRAPFPEEMNRVLTGRIATLHFAATDWAADNLLREGVPQETVLVTGNTGIDALLRVRDDLQHGRLTPDPAARFNGKRRIVVTAHRRESFGEGFTEICEAIAEIAKRDDVQIIWPVHPNPRVQTVVQNRLGGSPNISLIEPLDYVSFVDLMRQSYLLITDSGGVQEEGPSLGKPILVLREKTERPEAVHAGTVTLVGADRQSIVKEATRLLDDSAEYDRRAHLHNPYGDGKACARIAGRIAAFLAG